MSRLIALFAAIVLAGGLLATPPAFGQASKGASPGKPAQAEKAKVDLNTAGEKELEELPGVGPATAKKIIAGRPYSSVKDLAKAGVPAATIEKIGPMVMASAPSAAAAAQKPAARAATEKSTVKAGAAAKSSGSEARVAPAKGMVWVNTNSGVFHREGDRWYGKTKEGKFMTEAEAVKAGYRPPKETAAKEGAK